MVKTEVFENDYVTVLDTTTRACPDQRWDRFQPPLHFVRTSKNNWKTQRVDADFFENGGKNLSFETKMDTRRRSLNAFFKCLNISNLTPRPLLASLCFIASIIHL